LARIYFAVVALEWVMNIAMYFISYSRMPGIQIWSFLLSWLRVAGFLAGWVTYFRRSQRVRNTYGMNL
jgi:cytochrome c oxidase subunit IV